MMKEFNRGFPIPNTKSINVFLSFCVNRMLALLFGTLVPVGGQLRGVRGTKEVIFDLLNPRGHLTKPLPPPLFLLIEGKSGGIASNSSITAGAL
jgi:hypothetical protein